MNQELLHQFLNYKVRLSLKKVHPIKALVLMAYHHYFFKNITIASGMILIIVSEGINIKN